MSNAIRKFKRANAKPVVGFVDGQWLSGKRGQGAFTKAKIEKRKQQRRKAKHEAREKEAALKILQPDAQAETEPQADMPTFSIPWSLDDPIAV
jgi:hypothetical protein